MDQIAAARSRRKSAPYDPNNRRIRELSKLAKERYPDGCGDYVLPDTPVGQRLAVALITHLACAGPRKSRWLSNFCAARVPWLDPDEIDVTQLHPDRAQELGNLLQLTAAVRDELHITTIAPCDQTPEQRAALRKERKRLRDRERRRAQRQAARRMTRAAYLAANSVSKTKPWLALGISRATWFRRRETSASPTCLSSMLGDAPVSRASR